MMTTPFHPTLSIIIPVHNRADLLTETLDSLAALTGRPLEVVLVDNDSTDGSLACCEAFKARMEGPDFMVRVCSEPRPGANFARNTGFQVSQGDYVWFFDSDDRLFPDSLTRLLVALRSSDNQDLLVVPYVIRDRMDRLHHRPHRFSADPTNHLIDPVVATHNMCLTRNLVAMAGGWNPELSRWQDFEFGFRVLLKASNIAWLEGLPFYEVRDHASSISNGRFIDDLPLLENSLQAIRSTLDNLEDKALKNRLLKALGFKWASLAGLVRKEGHKREAHPLMEAALDCLPSAADDLSRSQLVACKSLYRLTAWYGGLGGRGIWRLADALL